MEEVLRKSENFIETFSCFQNTFVTSQDPLWKFITCLVARDLISTVSVTTTSSFSCVILILTNLAQRTALNRTPGSYVWTRSKYALLACALTNSRLYTVGVFK